MVIKLAQAKFPDALGMEMKEIKIASARAAAGHHVLPDSSRRLRELNS